MTDDTRSTLLGLAEHYRAEAEDDMVELCEAALRGDTIAYGWVQYELLLRPVPRCSVDYHLLRLGVLEVG